MTTTNQPFTVDYDLTDATLVAANARGEISDVQRSALAMQTASFGCVLPVLLVFATIVGFVLITGWSFFGKALLPTILVSAVVLAIAVFVLPPVLRFAATIIKARRDLRENAVTEALGQIVWRKRRYQAEIAGRPHGMLNQVTSRSRKTDLAPGDYRFFLLPRSGLIISAVPLQAADNYDQQAVLGQAFDFTPDDLLANMRGELTGAQRARMRGGSIVPIVFGAIFCIVGIAVAATSRPILGGGLVFALIFCGVGGLFLYNSYTSIIESWTGKPSVVEGALRKEVRQSSRAGSSYYCHVGAKQFSVQKIGYEATLAERLYRVYYAPRSNTLLSIVLLDE